MHGKGKMTYTHKDIVYFTYEGDFVEGKKTGKGRFKDEFDDSYSVYEGDFVNGKPNGKGIRTGFRGDSKTHTFIQEGDWVNGELHGKGKYLDNSEIYEGDYINGKKYGRGILTYANGNVYEGDFVVGFRHGKGKETYAAGKIEEGNWEFSRFVGDNAVQKPPLIRWIFRGFLRDRGGWISDGRMYNPSAENIVSNNIFYEDDITFGKFCGKGEVTFPDGRVYAGSFNNGRFNGRGKMIYPDRTVEEGKWKDGKFVK
jgi:hypothetical protein